VVPFLGDSAIRATRDQGRPAAPMQPILSIPLLREAAIGVTSNYRWATLSMQLAVTKPFFDHRAIRPALYACRPVLPIQFFEEVIFNDGTVI